MAKLYRLGYRWKRLGLEGKSEPENIQNGPGKATILAPDCYHDLSEQTTRQARKSTQRLATGLELCTTTMPLQGCQEARGGADRCLLGAGVGQWAPQGVQQALTARMHRTVRFEY